MCAYVCAVFMHVLPYVRAVVHVAYVQLYMRVCVDGFE